MPAVDRARILSAALTLGVLGCAPAWATHGNCAADYGINLFRPKRASTLVQGGEEANISLKQTPIGTGWRRHLQAKEKAR